MLRITLDAFSGVGNPSYVGDEDVSRTPEVAIGAQAGFDGRVVPR